VVQALQQFFQRLGFGFSKPDERVFTYLSPSFPAGF
jgi:hypothetical protein